MPPSTAASNTTPAHLPWFACGAHRDGQHHSPRHQSLGLSTSTHTHPTLPHTLQARIAMVNTILTALGMWALQIPGVGLLSLFVFICGFIPIVSGSRSWKLGRLQQQATAPAHDVHDVGLCVGSGEHHLCVQALVSSSRLDLARAVHAARAVLCRRA